ncbi:DedA family protein [Patulibacter sp.]|uniref:DedA family protein n=1 Tax=Patulibacter sp. TaxID=1912859 RepID=UPI00271BB6A8|nr:VTT domain-containing protein [Patulibacter sp.]MDO9408910.1 VTT domain-containing protein [Patulibacter sp.]
MIATLLAAVDLPLALGPSWLDPEHIVREFGFVAVLLVVFAECGLLAFFLPGDSLLFTTGVMANADSPIFLIDQPLWLLCVTISIAAVVGDQVGFLIGRKAGPAIFSRPDSRFFKQEYLSRAEDFFTRYGGRTIFLARFVPIVRTAAPLVAGASGWDYKDFVRWNVLGGVVWGAGVTALGYALGGVDFINRNIEAILLLIVLVSVLPMVFEVLAARRRGRRAETLQSPEERAGAVAAAED